MVQNMYLGLSHTQRSRLAPFMRAPRALRTDILLWEWEVCKTYVQMFAVEKKEHNDSPGHQGYGPEGILPGQPHLLSFSIDDRKERIVNGNKKK